MSQSSICGKLRCNCSVSNRQFLRGRQCGGRSGEECLGVGKCEGKVKEMWDKCRKVSWDVGEDVGECMG